MPRADPCRCHYNNPELPLISIRPPPFLRIDILQYPVHYTNTLYPFIVTDVDYSPEWLP
jgi:hypothetical protein